MTGIERIRRQTLKGGPEHARRPRGRPVQRVRSRPSFFPARRRISTWPTGKLSPRPSRVETKSVDSKEMSKSNRTAHVTCAGRSFYRFVRRFRIRLLLGIYLLFFFELNILFFFAKKSNFTSFFIIVVTSMSYSSP